MFKKMHQSHQISSILFSEIAGFSMAPRDSRILEFVLLSSLTYSQIWVIPFVADGDGGDVTKLPQRKLYSQPTGSFL
jgi:hypothetical protein